MKRPAWSAFSMESAFWNTLQSICRTENITYDAFVANAVRLGIIGYLRQQSLKPPAAPPATTFHVLVVDDVLMNREIASSFLRGAGHNVTCVDGGVAALVAVRTTVFDVVLMDVRMPEMDGFEATRRIRALEGKPGRVPIVALTALSFPEQIEECYKAGMDGHLPKPFDPDTLLATVLRPFGERVLPDDSLRCESTSAKLPVVASSPVIDSGLPVFNQTTFERTSLHLAPETIASYLEIISGHGECLLRGLEGSDALVHRGEELAEAAYVLAGTAGLLGFERLTNAGRHFARSALCRAPNTRAVADDLSATIEATLPAIYNRLNAAIDA